MNLRGYSERPDQPRDVLGRFLVTLGVEPQAVPETTGETQRPAPCPAGRAARADDAGQRLLGGAVRPLLVGGTVAVLITSRVTLADLKVTEHARAPGPPWVAAG